MGAEFFTEKGMSRELGAAFTEAYNDARYEYGSRGYTGSLAEKHDAVIIDNQIRWEKDAYLFANSEEIHTHQIVNDKWGPAAAIPFATPRESEKPKTTTKTISVVVKGDPGLNPVVKESPGEWGYQNSVRAAAHKARHEAIMEAIKTKLRLKDTQRIDSVHTKKVAPTYRAKTIVSKEAKETRYVFNISDYHDTWETGFKSQAEARAALVEYAKRDGTQEYRGMISVPTAATEEYEISAITRRTSGEPIVRVVRELVKTEYTLEVVVEDAPKPPNRIDGWLFFGYASS